MKSNTLFFVLSIGLVLPVWAMAAPQQDLDRVNDIVNQARGMADAIRGGSATAGQVYGYSNPFSRNANSGIGVGNAAGAGTGVEIGTNDIKIQAGGRQFNIPRIGGNGPDQIDPGMANIGIGIDRMTPSPRTPAEVFRSAQVGFRNGQFSQSNRELSQMAAGSGPAPMSFWSLVKFADGDYQSAAEFAHHALAKSEVWDWHTLRTVYGEPNRYANQYVALQNAARVSGCDVSVKFLLGYHHLMLGHREEAARVFDEVQKVLPNDRVVNYLRTKCHGAPPQPLR